jgi:hypothetical protein
MTYLSTQDLHLLPNISSLKKLMKSLAVLDLIISPDWEDRNYLFNSQWSNDEELGSMNNGCGDELFVHFTKDGCFIEGMAHESQLSSWSYERKELWVNVLKQAPLEFNASLNEPAFSMTDISFCIWRKNTDSKWTSAKFSLEGVDLNDDIDGSDYLLECLDGNPKSYQKHVENYFEVDLPLRLIQYIYDHKEITNEIVKQINPDITLDELKEDLKEINYHLLQ